MTQPYNDATQSAPQAGSTFKPFALAAALEDGIGLSSMWDGHSPQTVETADGKPYVVKNYGGESYGKISLLQATEDSVNTVYVPLSLQVGTDKVVDAARRAGLPDSVHIDSGATVPLGTASPSALDMASAYATFAAGGIYRAPHTVRTVKGANGGLQYKAKTTGTTAFSPEVIADLDYALQRVVTNGTGFAAQALGRPSAGKTGTTNAGRSAWYTGYVPQIATAVDLFRPRLERAPHVSRRCRRPQHGDRWLVPGPDLDRLHDRCADQPSGGAVPRGGVHRWLSLAERDDLGQPVDLDLGDDVADAHAHTHTEPHAVVQCPGLPVGDAHTDADTDADTHADPDRKRPAALGRWSAPPAPTRPPSRAGSRDRRERADMIRP